MKPGDEGYVSPVRGKALSTCCRAPIVTQAPGSGDLSTECSNCHKPNPQKYHKPISDEDASPQQYEGIRKPEPVSQPHVEHRRRMPIERQSLTHKVTISGQEGYITAGMYEDGSLGEVFIAGFGKEGSTQVGWINSWAIAVSHALQYGSSLRSLARKYHLMKFEPNGTTDNPTIPTCQSVPDYIFKWLVFHFGDDDLKEEIL